MFHGVKHNSSGKQLGVKTSNIRQSIGVKMYPTSNSQIQQSHNQDYSSGLKNDSNSYASHSVPSTQGNKFTAKTYVNPVSHSSIEKHRKSEKDKPNNFI